MKIALIGYGKMGQAIARLAEAHGHTIVAKINHENQSDFNLETIREADVAIEFTQPEAALKNVMQCLEWGVPVVSGTTGWNEELHLAETYSNQKHSAFLHTSNFSLGVNLFFAINEQVAALMSHYKQYNVEMEEVHHTAKKDAPSGTAITLAEKIINQFPSKKEWRLNEVEKDDELKIIARRLEDVPGTHTVHYLSAVDSLSFTHTAHSRDGFAEGALLAAEFIAGKQGVFTMKDVLGLK